MSNTTRKNNKSPNSRRNNNSNFTQNAPFFYNSISNYNQNASDPVRSHYTYSSDPVRSHRNNSSDPVRSHNTHNARDPVSSHNTYNTRDLVGSHTHHLQRIQYNEDEIFTIATHNVRSLNNSIKQDGFIQAITTKRIDIVGITDTCIKK